MSGGLVGDPSEPFLSHPRVRDLDEDTRVAIAAAASVIRLDAGSTRRGDDELAGALMLVRAGKIEVRRDGVALDRAEAGDLTRLPAIPPFTLVALEAAECEVLLASALARVGAGTGLPFLVEELRSRMRAAGLPAGPDLRDAPVRAVVSGKPVVCDAAEPLRAVAGRMSEHGATAAVVRDGDALGIVTDADFRARAVAASRPGESPVGEIATSPVRSVGAETPIGAAIVEMLDRGIGHLPVIGAGGEIVGVLSLADVLGVERVDPLNLRAAFTVASSVDDVAQVAGTIASSAIALRRGGLGALDVARVVSSLLDTSTQRLLDLAIAGLGEPPAPWAWIALGSLARHETAFSGDQDHTLVWEGGDEHDPYFAELAERVTAGLELAGYPRCPSNVLATVPGWRGGLAGWLDRLDGWMSDAEPKGPFLVTIALDQRQVAGPLDAGHPIRRLLSTAAERPALRWRLARLSTELEPPIGFLGQLVARRAEDGDDVVDVKEGGLLPVVDLARLAAVGAGVTATGTVARLRAAADVGALDREEADALEASFETFAEIRFDHQAAQVRAGEAPDNLIAPSRLDRVTRTRLREAFRVVDQVQEERRRRLGGSRFR